MKTGMDTVIDDLAEQNEAKRQRSITEQLAALDDLISEIEQLAYSDPRHALRRPPRSLRMRPPGTQPPRQTVTRPEAGPAPACPRPAVTSGR